MCFVFVSGKSLTMQTWQQIVFLSFNGKRLNHPISPSPHLPWIHTTERCVQFSVKCGQEENMWAVVAHSSIHLNTRFYLVLSLNIFVFERKTACHVTSRHFYLFFLQRKLALQLPLKIKETEWHVNIWNMDNTHKSSENKEQTVQRQGTARQKVHEAGIFNFEMTKNKCDREKKNNLI